MSRGGVLYGVAALAAGAIAGAAAEAVLARRVLPKPGSGAEIGGPPAGERRLIDSFDGTTLETFVVGRSPAPALIFAHGIIESVGVWHYQMRDTVLADRYSLVAYNARGHGRSGPARGPYGHTPFTSITQARDLEAVFEQTASGRAVLVGHSMGGIAIQALWDAEPPRVVRDRVAGVVLVNTTFTADLAGWRGRGAHTDRGLERVGDVVQRLFASERLIKRFRPGYSDLAMIGARVVYGRNPRPEHLDASVRTYMQTHSGTLAASIDLAKTNLHHVLEHIDVPVLVVTGTHDRITPPWLSDEIAARIPNAELVVLQNCGHMTPFERPEELNSLIAKFSERVL